ncbi:amino acid adenylation domain-containing protein [Streptomyces sp. NPDC048595]|uniref:non-ribosomal peptide synthetase n=1 Tax=Streptomyces sp. NPDC048595 TaxID=3365576 RepID=UPI003719143A
MTFTDSTTRSASHSFPSEPGRRTAQHRGRPGERLERSFDVVLPPEDGELSRASVLTVAMAVLVHRYTALDRVSIDVLDGRNTLCVALADESSTIDLIAGLSTAPRSEREPGPFALAFTGRSGGADTPAVRAPGPFAVRELVLHADLESSKVTLSFDAAGFDDAYADRIAGHYQVLLDHMVRTPHAPVARLNILTPRETDTMLRAWNDTDTRLTEDICLHQAFEARAAEAPDAVAAVFGAESWSFGTVNRRANEIAHRLITLGVGPDVRVGIHLEKTPDLLMAILGVLKAGGAYVPLDPKYPQDRLETMVLGTGCAVMISSRELDRTLSARVRHQLLVDEPKSRPDAPAENPVTEVRPDSLCYVIHTSGSTGTPKPIALCHRGVLNNLADLNARYGVGPDDAVLALSSPSFDMSVYEFLGITLAGGTVVIPEAEAGYHPASWWELAERHHVTVWNTAPPLIELFLDFVETGGDTRPLPLKLCMTGGDWVPATMPARFRKIAPRLRFVALGGATEASIHSTAYEWDPSERWSGGHLPYGRPLANQRTYLLDERMMPVPVGVPGELYLAGVGLARGYLDRPQETTERFVQWSGGEHLAERLYRTGDMARFWPDGLIEILGRQDFQVKINGIRVELGEIESALAAHPGVKRAVVVSRTAPDRHVTLVAYVTAERGGTLEYAALFDALHARLPKHMVPSSIEILDALPLNKNGKVDRRALSSPTHQRTPAPPTPQGAPARAGDWYRTVLEAWRDVLDVDHLDGHDNFFAVGGDSMKAIRSMVRIDRRLRVSDIYEHPTVTALADHLTDLYGEQPGA